MPQAGRYVVLEGIEMSPEHVLDVSSDFEFVHGRAAPMEDGGPGALVCIMVAEDARVVTYRNGRIKEIYPKKKGA